MTPAGPAGRTLLLVAGSGRSGTSLAAGICARLGFTVPQPEVEADATNPHGFSEPRWLVDLHDRLLTSACVTAEDGRPSAWERTAQASERPRPRADLVAWLAGEFGHSDRVVLKDPRLAWFLPLHRHAAGEVGAQVAVLTMIRHPAASIRSRELAYGSTSSPTTRLVGWLNMMLGIEHATRGLDRALVHYPDLLADWEAALSGALDGLLLRDAEPEGIAAATALVDPTLVRAEPSWEGLEIPPYLTELAEESFAALRASGRGEDVAAGLDDLRARFRGYYDVAEQVATSSVRGARLEARRAARRRASQEEQPASTPERRRRGIRRTRR